MQKYFRINKEWRPLEIKSGEYREWNLRRMQDRNIDWWCLYLRGEYGKILNG